MADLKISAATPNPAPAGTDNFATDKAGADFRTSLAQVNAFVLANAGDVFKVGTPLVNELGVWTGDGTIRGFAGFEFDGSQFSLPNYSFPVADGSADQVLSTDGAGVVSFKDQVPGGGLLSVKYLFDTDTTAADPGQGNIRFNNATPASVTAIYIDAIDENALDVSNILNLITTNDRLYIQSKEDATDFLVFNVTAPITDNTGWFTITGTVQASGNLPADGEEQLVVLQIGGAATGADVFKVGTPVNNQLGVWTGDGTIEGTVGLTYDGVDLDVTGNIKLNGASRPSILNAVCSLTVPTLIPFATDPNTGIGGSASDQLALICGGVTAMYLRELASGVLFGHKANIGLTADVGSSQGDGAITSSFNVYSTVATPGDAATLPDVFLSVGIQIHIKNDGANSMDVFPASGDDLGQGVDTPLAVPAGTSVAFLATIAGSTWTQIQFEESVGITAIVQDLSPQLGGDLDTNGFNITNLDTTLLGLLIAAGSDGSGIGGTLTLRAGASGASGAKGGSVVIEATNGAGGGAEGGDISLTCGNASGSGDDGGDFLAKGGVGTGGGGDGGTATLEAGRSVGGGIGGVAATKGGEGNNGTGVGGIGRVIGGTGGLGGGDGGDAEVTGGAGVSAGSDGAGGDFVLSGGLGAGAAADGDGIVNLGGVEFARFKEGSANRQFILEQNNAVALPTLAFGDGDSGFFESSDDQIGLSLAGIQRWFWAADTFGSLQGAGPAMLNEPTSFENPTLVPNRGDLDTGIGSAQVDNLSLITGGVQALRIGEGSGGVLFQPFANLSVTAFAAGGQGQFTLLNSYNVITTAASPGASVDLPPTFQLNTLVYIKNNGANEVDVFPSLGDDLGAGTNIAISLPVGEAISFIGTVASTTWTRWFGDTPHSVDNDAVQARRTTVLILTTAYVDVTMDATDVETDAAVIEHNDIATDDIDVLVAGTYEITYDVDVETAETSGSLLITMDGRVRLNDAGTGIVGSDARCGSFRDTSLDGEHFQNHLSCTFIADLAANDSVTLQLRKTELAGAGSGQFDSIRQSLKVRRLI